MTIKKKYFIVALVLSLAAGALIMFGAMEIAKSTGVGTIKIENKEYEHMKYMTDKYAKAEELWQEIKNGYYTDVKDRDLEVGMYKGIFEGLDDPYSAYMTKKEYESWMASATGEFEGVGVTFTEDDNGNYVILNTVSGSPAEKAGIKAGDFILEVDGKEYTDMDALGAALRGDKGTQVKVTYSRDGEIKNVTLTRAKIVTETVESEIKAGNKGYIEILSFEENTAEDFESALHEMEVKNVDGVVIDLRNNGGGLVSEGLEIADRLLGKGTITYTQDHNGKKEYYDSNQDKTKLPYVLLVNEGTASTSEIIAAAVKDTGDGILAGTKTFGKGIIQNTRQLSEGDAFKLTTYQYFSPKGKTIHKKGVKPEYFIKDNDSEETDIQLDKALDLLR